MTEPVEYYKGDTKLTQCAHCQLYFPRNELDGYDDATDKWARFIPNYDGPLWCIFCEYDGDGENQDATPGVASPNGEIPVSPDTDNIVRAKLVQAFKSTICKQLGETNSSLFARQVLPIAWRTAKAMGFNPYEFVKDLGYRNSLLREKGYPAPPEPEWHEDEVE